MRELKKIFAVISIFLSYLILVSILKGLINGNESKGDRVLVEAKILGVAGGRTSGKFDCLFKYKNKKIDMRGFSTISQSSNDFLGKTFPAMYSPNKDILNILLTPKDFEKFKMPFPDSLNWVIHDVSHWFNVSLIQ